MKGIGHNSIPEEWGIKKVKHFQYINLYLINYIKGGDGHFIREEVFWGIHRVVGKDIELMPILIISNTHLYYK